ncbi:hypothetical protein ACFXDE_28175 [Kitasatospora sp. NPDC059408]|uniref:hypothetical protein n=1 Tax=Kitasatospora sp. NPDC059408 TaxID=3346823 RepID=UPI00367F2009
MNPEVEESVMSPEERLWDVWKRFRVPEYVRAEIIDDDDHGGAVTILTDPDVERRAYNRSARVPYGKEAVIEEGPAKGFVIGPEITGERRG